LSSMIDMYRTLVVQFSLSFNATATADIHTLSLHDALPISIRPTLLDCIETWIGTCDWRFGCPAAVRVTAVSPALAVNRTSSRRRSEEHTSELQSRRDLVCRLLLEKKKVPPSDSLVAH